MDNIIIATFNDDKTAIDAAHKLRELDLQDDVAVFSKLLLRKNPDGTFEYLKDENDVAGWATLGGTLVGGAIGVLAGPVGVLVGALTGFTIGGVTDIARYSFDLEFLDNIKKGLPNGTTTLIAQLNEPSDAFVNTAFEPFGVTIWRTNIYAERDKYVQSQIDLLDAEIEEAERELAKAAADEKAKFERKLTELRPRRDAKLAAIKSDFEDDIGEMADKLARFGEQLQGKIDDAKRTRLEHKLAKYQAKIEKYQARAATLNAEIEKARQAAVGR